MKMIFFQNRRGKLGVLHHNYKHEQIFHILEWMNLLLLMHNHLRCPSSDTKLWFLCSPTPTKNP